MTRAKIKVTERGWAGHFICSSRCLFRRNTLIESDTDSVVVSTVGAFKPKHDESFVDTIGAGGRYYETAAFGVIIAAGYIEANVFDQRDFESPWQIKAESQYELPEDVDNIANAMHDKVVAEFVKKLRNLK